MILKGNMYICFHWSFVMLYIFFQVACPVGMSYTLFKILYKSFDPLLFFNTGIILMMLQCRPLCQV